MTKHTPGRRSYFLAASQLHSQLAEDVLDAAEKLIAARQRPREGWHNRYRSEAETNYFYALNEYAAVLATHADPDVWRDRLDRARRQIIAKAEAAS